MRVIRVVEAIDGTLALLALRNEFSVERMERFLIQHLCLFALLVPGWRRGILRWRRRPSRSSVGNHHWRLRRVHVVDRRRAFGVETLCHGLLRVVVISSHVLPGRWRRS